MNKGVIFGATLSFRNQQQQQQRQQQKQKRQQPQRSYVSLSNQNCGTAAGASSFASLASAIVHTLNTARVVVGVVFASATAVSVAVVAVDILSFLKQQLLQLFPKSQQQTKRVTWPSPQFP